VGPSGLEPAALLAVLPLTEGILVHSFPYGLHSGYSCGVESFRIDVADGVALVTFDRPPVNAIDTASMRELVTIFGSFTDDRDVRAAVFTAAGQRAFIAGVDLTTVGAPSPPEEIPASQRDDGPRSGSRGMPCGPSPTAPSRSSLR
jgi:hypothetical protein